jgi:Domain of unknown function (DUF1905)
VAKRVENSGMDPELARFLSEELGEAVTDAPTVWDTEGPVWIWRGSDNGVPPKAAWYFLSITGETAAAIAAIAAVGAGRSGGFGSVRVDARIGTTSWQTSLFRDRAEARYLLPLKAAVRRAEGLEAGMVVPVRLAMAHRS